MDLRRKLELENAKVPLELENAKVTLKLVNKRTSAAERILRC